MEKKTYLAPEIKVVKMEQMNIICLSDPNPFNTPDLNPDGDSFDF